MSNHHQDDLSPDSLRKILLQTLASIFIVILLVFASAFLFRNELIVFSEWFVKFGGYVGLFFGMVLSDSLPAFVPPDAFLMMSIAGGMHPFLTILVMGFGSLVGGSIAYSIGRYLIPRFSLGRKIVLRYEDKLLPYLRKYGFWAVVLAAVTPIPYSWMAYTVGSFKMKYTEFLLGSLFRFFRMGVYYFAMVLGWVSGV